MRLPLYGKILGWFFLNLVVVGAMFALLFDAQFHLGLDWLFAAGARDRLEAVRDLIIGELETTTPDDWPQVMHRYGEAYGVRFGIFDDEARPFVGDVRVVPEEVRTRILERSSSGRSATPRPADAGRRWSGRVPFRVLMRTTDPTFYWLLASARLDNPLAGGSMRVVLVARSETISAGGLILNPRPWLLVAAGVFVFSLLFWVPLVRGITRSIARMMNATRQLADGHFDVRVPVRRHDELGSLAESINQMAARLDGLVKGQKRFLGDIAHELCAPLARLQMSLGILEQRASGDDAQFVRAATEKAGQIAELVGELLSFSKASFGAAAVHLQPVKVADTARAVAQRERLPGGGEIRVEVADELTVSADPELLGRALGNLVRNALQHAAGPVDIRAWRAGHEVEITVADEGPGVPDAELRHIFDAFYRLDASRARATGGTGLGLAIVKTCVESCGGSVTAQNRAPRGLEVRLTLHAAAVECAAPSAP